MGTRANSRLRQALKQRLDTLLAAIEKNVPLEAMEKPLANTPISFRFGPVGPLARQRGEEPVLNVRFISPGGGLRQIKAQAAQLIEETAVEIETNISELLPPEFQHNVLNSKIISERWPWTSTQDKEHPVPALPALKVLIRNFPDSLPLHEREPNQIPPEVAPLDVLEWIRYELNLAELTTNWTTLNNVEWQKTDDQKQRWHTPAPGFALLYMAVKSLQDYLPAPPRQFPLSVERVPVHAMTGVGGTDPRELKKENSLSIRGDPAQPDSMVLQWEDGDQLELPIDAGVGPLVAVGRRYGQRGPAAVRDLLALYLFTWAARSPAGESFWWWPDEHLEIVGLKKNKENKRRLYDWLEDMGRAKLKAHYRHGQTLRGPLVTASLTAEDRRKKETARRLHLHPALYKGVTDEDNQPGTYFWPTPIELLSIPADGTSGRVHILAPVLGGQWRAELSKAKDTPPVAKIGVDRLASYLALRPREDRMNDPRTAEQLQRTIEAGFQCGLSGKYWVERGSLGSLSGVLHVEPGPLALKVLETRQIGQRPAWIPATGNDLDRWLASQKLSAAKAAELLDINKQAMQRARQYGPNPLPVRVRKTLRRYLWASPGR